jgi:hypothetical protein
MMHARPRKRSVTLAAVLVASALGVGAASANADSPLEGVWSFNGGKVAIQAQSDGTLLGTVVAPTKFAQCTHPAGERMWTEIRRRPDGSYWGLHQWFFATDDCIRNPALGPAAWRVLQAPNGERFLRACFSEPGSSSQPTIAANGGEANATFGCADSALIAALPEISSAQLRRYVKLPSNRACVRGRKLRIRMHDPRNDPLERIVVKLDGGKIHRRARLKRHGKTVTATLRLSGLPAGPFTVSVRLTTVLGEHLSGRRTYVRCGTRPGQRSGMRSGRDAHA